MFKILFFSSLLITQAAYAQAEEGPSMWESLIIPMGAFFLIFFFLVIRPQAKKAKEAEEIISSLKKGDQVLTGGGILGTIVGVSEKFVDVKVSDTSKIKVLKTSVMPYSDKPKESVKN